MANEQNELEYLSTLFPNSPLPMMLKCSLCESRPVQPKMCKICTHLFCSICLQLISSCPNCNASFSPAGLISCDFIDQFFRIVDSTRFPVESFEKCELHDMELYYYCTSCVIPLCSDCVLMTARHKDHNVTHLKNIYEAEIENILKDCGPLNQAIKVLTESLQLIETNREKVKENRQRIKDEINSKVEDMQNQLSLQCEEYLQEAESSREVILGEIKRLREMLLVIDNKINQSSKFEFILACAPILEKIKEMSQRLENIEVKPVSAYKFQSEVAMDYVSSLCILENYSNITKEIVYSDRLSFENTHWRLKIYPRGHGMALNTYISIFIELIKSPYSSGKYQYCIELINHIDSKSSLERENVSEFEVSECWGYNRFFRNDLLEEEGFLNQNGSLYIKFSVRPYNYYQAVKNQQELIEKIKRSTAKNKKEAKRLKNAIKMHKTLQLPHRNLTDAEENPIQSPNSTTHHF